MTTRKGEPWRTTLEGVVVACRLTPKGGRDAIDGVARLADGSSVLLARVRSAPEDGRANKALCALLAEKLDAPVSRVRLAAGARSRLKQVAVGGDPEALIARLRAL
ncbi:MAG: DUF167 family protein [Roseiarcus sp.]|uniref:DUF167 family protein n=1 Tax=Roseiarcus sp. TaxID=1969460 RepID=UPI003BB17A3C